MACKIFPVITKEANDSINVTNQLKTANVLYFKNISLLLLSNTSEELIIDIIIQERVTSRTSCKERFKTFQSLTQGGSFYFHRLLKISTLTDPFPC